MRRYISCWMLQTRAVLWKILAALAAMCALECLDFYRTLRRSVEARSFDALIDASHTVPIAYLGYILCWAILLRSLYGKNNRRSYTLMRLRISERAFYHLQSLTNALCLLLLWGAQAAAILIMLRLYLSSGVLVGPQAIFLSFYRSEFLGAVIPLQRVTVWLMDLVFCLTIGIFLSDGALRLSRGASGIPIFAILALGAVRVPYGASLGFRGAVMLVMLVLAAGTLASDAGIAHPGIDLPGDPDEPREPYRPLWEEANDERA